MKEIRDTKLVKTAITKITYQSDDGNCTSEDREKGLDKMIILSLETLKKL